jgi:predicted aldo/keto reductase-like oxidoreductase
MALRENRIDRRQFLKSTAGMGIAGVFASVGCRKKTTDAQTTDSVTVPQPQKGVFPQVPRRKLGKTGIEVSCLSLGTMFNLVESQIVLERSLQWGVNYWDTANSYAGGNSELGIGKFLAKNPERRKELFIVSKASGASKPQDIEKRLQTSLERMNTDYIDLYYGVHALSNPGGLTDGLRQWAEDAKRRKLIRFLGFSTHRNMAKCLAAAARLDWIDAIMTSYNFRLMQDDEMQAAVEACHKAGIGLIAMKTQAHGQKARDGKSKKLFDHFLQRGFTPGQAKIKIVLQDERFASACVGMESVARVTTNVAAVLDKTKLTSEDMAVFEKFAKRTCRGYCAGCGEICSSALPDVACVSDVMRYLMYYKNYGRRTLARELFATIPADTRARLAMVDYGRAEALCPQKMPIGKLISEAVRKLA